MQIHYLKPIPYEEYKVLNTVQLARLVYTRIEQAVVLKTLEVIE